MGFSFCKIINLFYLLTLTGGLWACGKSTPSVGSKVNDVVSLSGSKDGSSASFVAVPSGLTEDLTTYFNFPEIIDYQLINDLVFNKGQCLSCHSVHGVKADHKAIRFAADLSDYSSVFLLNGIVRGDVDASKIFQASKSSTEHALEPVDGFKPLNDELLELLRLWILNCAIEDFNLDGKVGIINPKESLEKVRHCY